MSRPFFHCAAFSSLFIAGSSWAQVTSAEQFDDFHQAVEAARGWLKAKPADRASFEADLKKYDRDIDAIIQAIMPRGSDAFDEIKGREVKGDTFAVPELLERNADHPFNYYVPPHYDRAKPMGLILWMHGGGTYKPDKNLKRRSVENKIEELEAGDYVFVAAEACHGVNFPEGAIPDKLAGRWSVPASERYLADLVTEFMHRYHIDPNRIVLWGYSMGGIGAYNHAMRSDRYAVVGIGGGSWTYGTFDVMLNTPAFIWHGKNDSYWKSRDDCRNRLTHVAHARIADAILTDLGYDHLYIETDGGHNTVNFLNGKPIDVTRTYFFDGKKGYMVGTSRDPYPERVIAMTPRGIYESVDPLTSGDVYYQPESLHDRWVSIENYTKGPVPVDYIIKNGTTGKSESYEECLGYSATRSKSTFQGARVDVRNLGNNRFKATTLHVESYSLWLHPKMVDFDRPVEVTTNGVTAEYTCKPSLLGALKSYERRSDWGLIYSAKIAISVTGKDE